MNSNAQWIQLIIFRHPSAGPFAGVNILPHSILSPLDKDDALRNDGRSGVGKVEYISPHNEIL
jgi:hypothetical protein